MSEHPWFALPGLVEAEIISKEDARDGIIFAQRSTLRRSFRELQGLLPEMLARGEIEPKGVERIQSVITRAQMEESPDA